MPPLSQMANTPKSLNIMIYGREKSKKTWWALKTAELGFNVHVIQGDPNGCLIGVSQIDKTLHDRINVIDISPQSKGNSVVDFMFLFRSAIRGGHPIYYLESKRKTFSNEALAKREGVPYWRIDPAKLGANDLVVFDNLTNLTRSLINRFADETNQDLSDLSKGDTWAGFEWAGRNMIGCCESLAALPCPTVLIGHEQEYVKSRQEMKDGKLVLVPLWSRTQPISTSGPNVPNIVHMFDPVLRFYMVGSSYMISSEARSDVLCGSRLIPGKTWSWSDLPPKKLFEAAGALLPEYTPSTAVSYIIP